MPELHIISPVSVIASLLLATGLAGSAEAEVKSVAPSGFKVVETMTIHAPPEQVYAAWARPANGGVPLTPSRAMPPISVSISRPVVAFASG